MKYGHNNLNHILYDALRNWAQQTKQWIIRMETPFVQPGMDDQTWVKGSLIPDILIVSAEQLAAYQQSTPNWRDRPLSLIPALVVEIISPTDRYSAVEAKIVQYLEYGVKIIWIIDPAREIVEIRVGGKVTRLKASETLTGGDLLPGFSIEVSRLFA